MTIGREKCLEMVKNDLVYSEFTEFGWQECHHYRFDEDEIEALINRAYAEGQKDMRERAAKACELHTGGNRCAEVVRHLEIE